MDLSCPPSVGDSLGLLLLLLLLLSAVFADCVTAKEVGELRETRGGAGGMVLFLRSRSCSPMNRLPCSSMARCSSCCCSSSFLLSSSSWWLLLKSILAPDRAFAGYTSVNHKKEENTMNSGRRFNQAGRVHGVLEHQRQ